MYTTMHTAIQRLVGLLGEQVAKVRLVILKADGQSPEPTKFYENAADPTLECRTDTAITADMSRQSCLCHHNVGSDMAVHSGTRLYTE